MAQAASTFDTIVLLTDPTEQVALAPVLKAANPALRVVAIATLDELNSIDRETLRHARLIGFVTAVIVPSDILDALGFGAFNFHPGPPAYPGWAPAHFALYDGAKEFGATFHVMANRVDTGAIIDADRFAVARDVSVLMLEEMAYACVVQLFRRWVVVLASTPGPLPVREMRWGRKKNSRRNYQALCDIPPDIGRDDLARRMRAFGGNHFGIMPTIRLHGYAFKAVSEE